MVESHNAEAAERVKRVQRVLDDCLRRRAAGETWPDADVIAEHAELMPELEERLGALKLIEQAGRQTEGGSSAAVSLPADHIQGQCPQCEAKWRAGAEHAGRKVRCRKCGHVFAAEAGSSLVGVGAAQPSRVGGHDGPEPSSAGVLDSIPGYEIEGELGHGGMGCVYRAHELATKRTVALKVMLTGRHANERQRRRFEREVEIAAALQHPHIARLYASGLHEGQHWFAMEYVEGVPLDVYVEREHPTLTDLLSLFARICHAANHAHQRGVMHRDLKPGNILVDGQAQPRILDFGLAKQTDQLAATDESISMPGEVAGTPSYMSPEQTQGDPSQIDIRSDVYSLGVILYRLLTGQSPYGEQTGLRDLLKAINELEPESPRRLRKDVPDEVNSIVLRALEKDPIQRYQTAGELARDVEAYLAGDPVTAKQGSGWYTLRKTASRYKGVAAVVLLVVGLSLGMGLTFGTLWSETRTELNEVIKERTVYRDRLVRVGLDPDAPPYDTREFDLAEARETIDRLRATARAERERVQLAQAESKRLRAELGEDASADQVALRRLVDDFIGSFRSPPTAPLERFEQHVADGVIAVSAEGPVVRGKAAYLEKRRKEAEAFPVQFSRVDVTYNIDSIRAFGAVATVFFKVEITIQPKGDGAPLRRDAWVTLAFHRFDADWWLVLEQATWTQDAVAQPAEHMAKKEDGGFSQVVTFRTARPAPRRFDAWTFKWIVPDRGSGANLDYVVLEPDGEEHFQYNMTRAAPGQRLRSDFSSLNNADPAVFHGQHIRFQVRAVEGRIRFQNMAQFEFQFFRTGRDGQVDWKRPFARIKAVVQE